MLNLTQRTGPELEGQFASAPDYEAGSGRALSRPSRFLVTVAGANSGLLERCPTEAVKFGALGMVMIMTSIWAMLTGGYAVWTVSQSLEASYGVAAFWGALIFTMERAVVSSLRSHNKWWKTILVVLPRLLLAFAISLAVSEPTVLLIFSGEIEAELARQTTMAAKDARSEARPSKEIDQLQGEIGELEARVKDQEKKRDEARARMIEEAEGAAVSGEKGKGPLFFEKRQEFEEQEKRLRDLSVQTATLIEQKRVAIDELESRARLWADRFVDAKESATGLMARLQALHSLMAQHPPLLWARMLLTLLFVLIDVLALLIKLTSLGGLYERMVQELEAGAEARFRLEQELHQRLTQEAFSNPNVSPLERQHALRGLLSEALRCYR
jgi:hypothetical protein